MNIAASKAFPQLLGGLTAQDFLNHYWQKKPLLIRSAIPGFGEALNRDGLIELSRRDDLESRFISRSGNSWQLEHGPFRKADIKRWRAPWSLLVQGVNLALPAGDRLLRAFDFIPYARLDDLMVSLATDGGGVGPHIDNYDVFLLQGTGRRRWRIGKQADQTLTDGMPLRILKNFRPTEEWILEPGDMLYLPPEWAHDGVAEGECMTWSIGFRTSPAQEIADNFLTFLQDNLKLEGRYSDPGLQIQKHPSEIGTAMIDQVQSILESVKWSRTLVRDFLGTSLTEPKPYVCFDPPRKPLSAKIFFANLVKNGIHLDPRTQLLFSASTFYINGEREPIPRQGHTLIRRLADARCLPGDCEITDELATILHRWHCHGFLHFN